jgi:hypothetical protein
MYYFCNGLRVTKTEKIECIFNGISTERCVALDTDQLWDILEEVISEEKNIYYNEFIIESKMPYMKLILDIDINKETIQDVYINEKEELESLSLELVEYLKNTNFVFTGNSETAKKNIVYTKSNNPNKYSYHIIFNNIMLSTKKKIIKYLKSTIETFKERSLNVLAKYIDSAIYRESTQLRFIYSLKEKSTYFHIPFDDLSKETIHLYSIVNREDKNEPWTINEIANPNESELEMSLINTEETPYYMHGLDGEDIITLFKTIFNQIKLMEEDWEYIKNIKILNVNDKIKINIDQCYCCERRHKNPFVFLINYSNITLTKNGNPKSCNLLPKVEKYPIIKFINLASYLVKTNLIKRSPSGKFLIWMQYQWREISENYQFLHFIIETKYIFRKCDREVILNSKFNLLNHYISAQLGDNIFPQYPDPRIVKLLNGYYDLSQNKFTPFNDTQRHIYKKHGVHLEYKNLEDMNESEKLEYDESKIKLSNILEKIILKNEDKINIIRFKANVSATLYSGHKGAITFFVGKTNSGKTTVRQLIENLFKDSYITLPMDVYTLKAATNRGDPWKGSCDYKLVSFASESGADDIFRSKLIKQILEDYIVARELYSNNTKQVNHLSQFVDTNHTPQYDFVDPALQKRISIINFKSRFARKYERVPEDDDRILYEVDEKIESEVKVGKYSRVFFDLLVNWFREYHLYTLELQTEAIMPNTNKICADHLTGEEKIGFINFVRANTSGDWFSMDMVKSGYRGLYQTTSGGNVHAFTNLIASDLASVYLENECPNLSPDTDLKNAKALYRKLFKSFFRFSHLVPLVATYHLINPIRSTKGKKIDTRKSFSKLADIQNTMPA